MKPANRQRIIGLGLLCLLLAILVPWATNVPDDLQHQLDDEIPQPPKVEWLTLASPISEAEHAQVAANIAKQREQAVKETVDNKAGDKTAALRAYALQLKQFDSLEKARQVQQALKDAGYSAFIRQVAEQFVLYAGPELELARLKALQKRLLADEQFTFKQPQVVAYHP